MSSELYAAGGEFSSAGFSSVGEGVFAGSVGQLELEHIKRKMSAVPSQQHDAAYAAWARTLLLISAGSSRLSKRHCAVASAATMSAVGSTACCAGVTRWAVRLPARQLPAGLEAHCNAHAPWTGLTSYKENAGPQTIGVLTEAKSLVELEGSKSKIRSAGRKETSRHPIADAKCKGLGHACPQAIEPQIPQYSRGLRLPAVHHCQRVTGSCCTQELLGFPRSCCLMLPACRERGTQQRADREPAARRL